MEVLQAKNLKKIYGSGNNAVHALDGVDLSVKKGEFVAIVGTSGSGKSTLLHMLGGLDRPTSGTVMVDGQDIFSLKEEALTIFRRRKIGFVFQAYNLVPVLNVYENIVLPIELDGGKVNKDFVQQIVQTLGLDDRLDALPNQLSGGQQQRVAIARALALQPEVLCFDEDRIVMRTVKGELTVAGEGLHIGKLSLDTGELSVEGKVSELSYEEAAPAGGFWSRLFG